jgi:hypothetical protein
MEEKRQNRTDKFAITHLSLAVCMFSLEPVKMAHSTGTTSLPKLEQLLMKLALYCIWLEIAGKIAWPRQNQIG